VHLRTNEWLPEGDDIFVDTYVGVYTVFNTNSSDTLYWLVIISSLTMMYLKSSIFNESKQLKHGRFGKTWITKSVPLYCK
jgi:hypothetical protein